MASKKYKLLFGLLTLITSAAFAQVGGSYSSAYDSSVIPNKRLAQHNEFVNNTYAFPAKPRNMWEIGASVGTLNIGGDVATVFPALGFEAHVRKAIGYTFSIRAQYLNGTTKGQNWLPSLNYGKNTAWVGYTPGVDQVFYNYKTSIQDLSLQGIINLNNILFHKRQTAVSLSVGAGIGATVYNTKVNARNAQGGTYAADFNNISNFDYKNRKDILDQLDDIMDDTYETQAQNQGNRRPKLGDNTLKPSGTVMGILAFRLGKRVNLALEDRFTLVKDDLLDGQQWQENPVNSDAALTGDFDSYNFLSLGLNFNIGAKAVEPLWWVNPLNYAYEELQTHREKLDRPRFDDADGDGVLDALDREPNTPADCPVDTHGVTADRDGDGVPDCRDKQLITPTECQPVDADGVGKCPCPEDCGTAGPPPSECPCDYPSLSFKGNSSALSGDAKSMLATVASKMKAGPDCAISITGYPTKNKKSQELCRNRVAEIRDYLIEEEGISADRISVDCQIDGGDTNTVDIKCN